MSSIKRYWISCEQFTCSCKVKDDIIIETAPIIRKFKGQKFSNLKNWVKNISRRYCDIVQLEDVDE